MFCDQDDIWTKDKIAITYNIIKEEEKSNDCFGTYKFENCRLFWS